MTLSGVRPILAVSDDTFQTKKLKRAQTAVNRDRSSKPPSVTPRAPVSQLKRSNTNEQLSRSRQQSTRFEDDSHFDSPSSTFSLKSTNVDPQSQQAKHVDKTLEFSKNLTQAELDYTLKMTRVVPKEELDGGLSLVEKIIQKNCKRNPSAHRPLTLARALTDYTLLASRPTEANNFRPITPSVSTRYLLNKRRPPTGLEKTPAVNSSTQPHATSTLVSVTTITAIPASSPSTGLVEKTVKIEETNKRPLNSGSHSPTLRKYKSSSAGFPSSLVAERRETSVKWSNEVFEERAHSDSLLSLEANSQDSFCNVPVINRRAQAHSAPINSGTNKAEFVALPSKKSQHVRIVEPASRSKFNAHSPRSFDSQNTFLVNNDENDFYAVSGEEANEEEEEEVDDDEQFEDKILNNTLEINRSNLQETLKMIQSKLMAINDEEMQSKSTTVSKMRKRSANAPAKTQVKTMEEFNQEKNPKTITRKQNKIIAKSMDVDKWVEVHKRRNTNQAARMLKRDMKTKAQCNEMNELTRKIDGVKLESENEPVNDDGNKSRSIRELSEMTVLDKVQSKLKVQLIAKLKVLRKMETQNEFNLIVERIKYFLNDVEMFKSDGRNVLGEYLDGYASSTHRFESRSGFNSSSLYTVGSHISEASHKSYNDLSKLNPIKLYELTLV
jgi:hypothetical protein